MALGGLWSRLTSGIFGVGIGVAASDAIQPALEPVKQDAWRDNAYKVLPLGELAELVAQALVTMGSAAEEASRSGYNGNRLEAAVQSALTVPGTGELLRMLRRGTITGDQLEHGFRKDKREPQWDKPLADLQHERLEAAEIAKAIHRNIIPGPDLLIVAPPLTPGEIEQVPQSKIDAVAEAEAAGFDAERLRVLVGNSGLPLSLFEMLQLLNRGKVTADDVRRSIAQSNLRNEYMEAGLELRRQLPTARDFVENALRGYRSLDDAIAGAALHGMEPDDATLIYQNQGRPMAVRQITQALARGGVFKPEPGEIADPYQASIVEGNLKPGYYDLARALRYNLPSPFVIRGLAQAGDLTGPETEQLLLDSGWPPELAAKVAPRWAAAVTGAGKTETKAELEAEYEGGYLPEAEFRAALTDLGYTGHVQDLLVHLGDARRLAKWREKVVAAIGAGYMAGKVDAALASSELAEVNVQGQAATDLLGLWDKLARASAQ